MMKKLVALLLAASLVLPGLLTGCGPAGPSSAVPSPSATATPAATDTGRPAGWAAPAGAGLWDGGSDYAVSEEEGALKIVSNKAGLLSAVTAAFGPVDISARPVASLVCRTDRVATLSVGIRDASGREAWMFGTSANQETACGSYPMLHSFDFSKCQNIDLTAVAGISVALNRGAPRCDATAWFTAIALGDSAKAAPALLPVPDQQCCLGDEPVPVAIYPSWGREMPPAWSAKAEGDVVKDLSVTAQGDHAVLTYKLAGEAGSATVTVTAAGPSGDALDMAFLVSVEPNLPPVLDDLQACELAEGASVSLEVTGIGDGNPAARQPLSVGAVSSDTAVVLVEGVDYASDGSVASLRLKAGSAGTASVTVTVKDGPGAETEKDFAVRVFRSLNAPPSFDSPDPVVLAPGGRAVLALEHLSAGEAGQRVSLTAASGDTALLSAGVKDGKVVLEASKGASGQTWVDITATDDGGSSDNNGNQAVTKRVAVTIKAVPLKGHEDGFDDESALERLKGSGEDAHKLSIEGGALRVDVDKYATNNAWAGLWYPLDGEIDLTKNPYITLRMKAGDKAPMLIFLWDANDVYNTAKTVTQVVDTEWADYTFDFTGLNLDGDGRTVDFAHIKSLLINFAPGNLYKGIFWLDDLKVGDRTGLKAAGEPLALTNPMRLSLPQGGRQSTLVQASGLDAGKARVKLGGSYGEIAEVKASLQPGGVALQVAALPGAAGVRRLIVTVEQDGNKAEAGMDLVVVDGAKGSSVTVDAAARFQQMDGMGAFLGTGPWDRDKQDRVLPWVRDMGITMARFGVIDREFEPANDNANPYVTDFGKFDEDALPLDWMRRLRDEGGVEKFVVTLWSPPHWMKQSKCLNASPNALDNYLEPRYYEEFAEHVAALVRVVKERTGIELYAVSLQNEPQFNEPYASALLDDKSYAALTAVVGRRLRGEGLATRIFMPEALPQQKGIESYITELDKNAEAAEYVDVIAIHNYDGDGIHVGGAGAEEWAQMFEWANRNRPRRLWMSETSGHADSWDGARTLFGNIYNALVYGNASGWMWWSFNDTAAGAPYGLVLDGRPTSRYAISRHFYRAALPGSVRVACSATDGILSAAFLQADGSIAVVLYNAGESRMVDVKGMAGKAGKAWITHEGQMSADASFGADGRLLLPAGAAATVIYR